MQMPIGFIPAHPRHAARPKRSAPTLPTPTALVLVAATYEDGECVILTFDRAIDASAFRAASVVVNDPVIAGYRFDGIGAGEATSPTTLRVGLSFVGMTSGSDTRLDVSTDNGIVAVDDGGTWAGCSGLLLPFGG